MTIEGERRSQTGRPARRQPVADQSNAAELPFDEHFRLVGDLMVDLRRTFGRARR